MSVVVRDRESGKDLLICKGAAEEVLACCSRALDGEGEVPLAESVRARVEALKRDVSGDGLRVIAVAITPELDHGGRPYGVADEKDLTLVGLVAFLDPPKDSAASALAALDGLGVKVKVITGDNDVLAREVCRDVGIRDLSTLLGTDVEAMDDAFLERAAADTTLFAKMSPAQ